MRLDGLPAEEAVIPANVVYMLVKPSTNYYRNMTEQAPLMPVLVGQVI